MLSRKSDIPSGRSTGSIDESLRMHETGSIGARLQCLAGAVPPKRVKSLALEESVGRDGS